MSVTWDILRSYVRPREIMRRQLAHAGETRALAYVMIACFLFFVARLPLLSREAHLDRGGPDFPALAAGVFVGAVLFAPLVLYGLAAASHVIAKGLGGQGGWLAARLALFWALLAMAPLVLFRGLIVSLAGPGPAALGGDLLIGLIFLYLWITNLREAERTGQA
ncbi:MAG: YIP1 family protein [Pseudomonadota bacterium]